MRDAKSNHQLSKLRDPKRKIPRINEFSFEGILGIEAGKISSKSSMLVICGGTGSGKSALLEAISFSINREYHENHASLQRLAGAAIRLTIDLAGKVFSARANLATGAYDQEGDPPSASLLRLEDRVSEEARFSGDIDLDVLLDGVGFQDFSKLQVECVSEVCGKKYIKVQVVEVETEKDRTVPFFRAETEVSAYDSRTMATGELSTFYLAWRAFSIPALSILLIEEPEAFLPPAKHKFVYKMIGLAADARSLGIVLTSHSAQLVAEVPAGELVPIKVGSSKSKIVIGKESKTRTLSRLGLLPTKVYLFYVEDELAQVSFDEILHLFDYPVSIRYEILSLGGDSHIAESIRRLPKSDIKFSAVFDGDMKEKYASIELGHEKFFLPFNPSVEEAFMELMGDHTEAVAEIITRSADAITSALEKSSGADLHDRFKAVARELGVDYLEMGRRLFPMWSKTHKKELREFASDLSARLGISG